MGWAESWPFTTTFDCQLTHRRPLLGFPNSSSNRPNLEESQPNVETALFSLRGALFGPQIPVPSCVGGLSLAFLGPPVPLSRPPSLLSHNYIRSLRSLFIIIRSTRRGPKFVWEALPCAGISRERGFRLAISGPKGGWSAQRVACSTSRQISV